jgi:hypothetical protein
MFIFRQLLPLLLIMALVAGCGSKKKKPSMAGEDKVEVADFIDFFKQVNLPFTYADSQLVKKEKDSLLINHRIFSQFVPDSILSAVFGKSGKPKIYALGKVEVPNALSYLFVKTVSLDKKAFFIICFDKRQQFVTSLTALRPDQNPSTMQTVVMDRKFGVTKNVIRRNTDGSISEGKDVYSLSAETRSFQLVMTDALDDKPTELINPIDTLPRKNKWSADYAHGKMNLVSIRDGRGSGRLTFFIHFEKNKGSCVGELKGDAIIRSSNTAEYRLGGDPCVLKFTFTSSSVTLKELEGCGSHRGIRCSFDGSFSKKRESKSKGGKKLK